MSDSERKKDERQIRPQPKLLRGNPALFALAWTAIGAVALFAIIVVFLILTIFNGHDSQFEWDQKNLDRQIAEIQTGQEHTINLYCSSHTDELLKRIENIQGIEEVRLDLTDVTDDGMQSLTHLKKLKTLSVYGGSPSVGDRGISHIKSIPSLECLELINTSVTDRSLPLLMELPNLQSLTLFHGAHRDTQFTAAGLQVLKELSNLKKLYVSGGLATDAAVAELQKALPNCSINAKDDEVYR